MRTLQFFAWPLLIATLGGSALAQEPSSAPVAKPQLEVKVQFIPQIALDVPSLSKALSAADLDAREATLDALVTRLSLPTKDEGVTRARAWLEKTSLGQGELAWTARMALREVETKRTARTLFADPMLELLEPGHTGLRQVEVHTQPRMAPGASDEADSIEVWVDDVRGGMQMFPVEDLNELGGCTFELRCGPGDVRLRIVEPPKSAPQTLDTDGDAPQLWMTRVREYAGNSLVEILSEHPELGELLPFEVPGVPMVKGALRTDVLGVYTRPLDDAVRVSLGLPPGVGLDVARVEPGTIAQALGLERGSVIIKLCGRDVTGEDGVSSVLKEVRRAARAEGAELEVEAVWIDAWGKRKTRTWRGAPGAK